MIWRYAIGMPVLIVLVLTYVVGVIATGMVRTAGESLQRWMNGRPSAVMTKAKGE